MINFTYLNKLMWISVSVGLISLTGAQQVFAQVQTESSSKASKALELKDLAVQPREHVKPKPPKADHSIKTTIKVRDDVSIGVNKSRDLDKRVYTDKEIQDHKDSMNGSSTLGVKKDF